jgi:hypothetical protein
MGAVMYRPIARLGDKIPKATEFCTPCIGE